MTHKQILTPWLFLLIVLLLPDCLAMAQTPEDEPDVIERIEIPSSFNPVGSGARALGMGSAFIAVADDATAASWNPGGLIQLGRPEVSVVGEFFHRDEDNHFGANPEASGGQSVKDANINYFSISHPFSLFKRNMIVSLNYQHLFDFNREWGFSFLERSERLSQLRDFDYSQKGNLHAIGLAYCIQATPSLSFGFTLNFWEDWLKENYWEQTRQQKIKGIDHLENALFTHEIDSRSRYSFSGFNLNMGLLWTANDWLTLGAVLKTPFTADLRHEAWTEYVSRYPTYESAGSDTSSDNETLDMPISYGIGVAYRLSDRLTLSADVYRTEWQDFLLQDAEGRRTCPISDRPVEESDVDPTHQVRVGAEYLFYDPATSKYVIPIRCGIFYDPAPAEGSPDDFYGFSLGTGIVVGRFVFDIAYQYRHGDDVGGYILQNREFSQDVKEHTLYSSVIIHF